jgi:hypothetical protein
MAGPVTTLLTPHTLAAPTVTPGWDAMERVVRDPASVAADLHKGTLWGVTHVQGRRLCDGRAGALTMALEPPVEAQSESYPSERVRVVALREKVILVYPQGPPRRWLHRNQDHPASLCLQHPDDDPALLWLWTDGLGRLLTRVRLHLLCEEIWRRTGAWPGVDLPHGDPTDGQLEPVTDPLLRKAVRRWVR